MLCARFGDRLTAFVGKSFHEAKDFIPVDDEKIAIALEWMIQNQARDGSFPEPPFGRVLHRDMQVRLLVCYCSNAITAVNNDSSLLCLETTDSS